MASDKRIMDRVDAIWDRCTPEERQNLINAQNRGYCPVGSVVDEDNEDRIGYTLEWIEMGIKNRMNMLSEE